MNAAVLGLNLQLLVQLLDFFLKSENAAMPPPYLIKLHFVLRLKNFNFSSSSTINLSFTSAELFILRPYCSFLCTQQIQIFYHFFHFYTTEFRSLFLISILTIFHTKYVSHILFPLHFHTDPPISLYPPTFMLFLSLKPKQTKKEHSTHSHAHTYTIKCVCLFYIGPLFLSIRLALEYG